jgi:hypothetical protein
MIVVLATDNIATTSGSTNTHTGVSDAGGNTWTKLIEWTRTGGAAADGATVSIWASQLTTGLSSGSGMTFTFSAAVTAKTALARYYTVGSGNTWQLDGSNGASGSSTTPSVTLSGLSSVERLWLGGLAAEGTATVTADADYGSTQTVATSGGTTDTNMRGYSASRVATLTSDTFNPTLSASSDWAIALVALREVAGDVTIAAPLASATAAGIAPGAQATLVAPLATASGDGVAPAPEARVVSPQASASGTALAPTAELRLVVPLATGTADALPPSLVTGLVVQAPVATATGDALVASLEARVVSPLASASADALVASPTSTIVVPLATATGDALAPTLRALLEAPIGTASAAALAPTLASLIQAALATATGQAQAPTLAALIQAMLGTATGEAPSPMVVIGGGDVTIVVPLATAMADGVAPSLIIGPVTLQAPLAAGSAEAIAPTLTSAIAAAISSATASATPADVVVLLPAALASGTASGLSPIVIVGNVGQALKGRLRAVLLGGPTRVSVMRPSSVTGGRSTGAVPEGPTRAVVKRGTRAEEGQ